MKMKLVNPPAPYKKRHTFDKQWIIIKETNYSAGIPDSFSAFGECHLPCLQSYMAKWIFYVTNNYIVLEKVKTK